MSYGRKNSRGFISLNKTHVTIVFRHKNPDSILEEILYLKYFDALSNFHNKTFLPIFRYGKNVTEGNLKLVI